MRPDKVLLVFKKDFIEISRNKEVLLPMIILPMVFAFLLPAISVISPNVFNSGGDSPAFLQAILQNLPESIHTMLQQLTLTQQATYVMLVYFFAPFFLIIPVMASSVIAADSFAGEKERNTLEALLATPLKDSELLLGKILVSFIPSMGVTILGFLLYTATTDLLTFESFGTYIMPTVPWLVLIFVLAPMVSLLGIGVSVIVSSKVKGFREAQQLSAILVIPLMALLLGQATGFLVLGSTVMITLAAVVGAVDIIVFRFGLRLFHRENRARERVKMPAGKPELKAGGKRGRALLAAFLAVSLAFNTISLVVPSNVFLPEAHAQGVITETVRRRNLVIDLGNGLKTDAQLTLPILGDGPYPGVLLIHGSGNMDMDEYIPPSFTGTNEPTRLLLQIAEYLSNRGFAVLRYNKRGVGLNGTILDVEAWGKTTIHDLVQDAEKALRVLQEQPEVDSSRISLIGHSEGTWIAPRIALKDPNITNIVLMGAFAQNLRELLYFQLVDRPIKYAEDTLDTDHDGLLSLQEVEASLNYINVDQGPLPPQALIHNFTGEWNWYPGVDTNEDGYFDIEHELKPITLAPFELVSTSDPNSPYYSPWLQSHFTVNDTTLDIIGNVSASILILQGEGETQTPVEQAFLLEQRLTEIEHIDHTLITYPGLGHTFYPVDGWIQPLGPMQDRVLADLFAWLKSPARTVRILEAQIQADAMIMESLQVQLTNQTQLLTTQLEVARNETRSVQTQLSNDLSASNALINDLQNSLSTYVTLTRTRIVILVAIALVCFILIPRLRSRLHSGSPVADRQASQTR